MTLVRGGFAGAPKRAAWFSSGVFAVSQDLYAVNEYMFHSDRVLVRLVESGFVRDSLRIKHDHIGKHSFFDKSAMI